MYDTSKQLLRKYFSDITYIDDKFDTNLIADHSEKKEVFGLVPPPRKLLLVEEKENVDAEVEKKELLYNGNYGKMSGEGHSSIEQLLFGLNDSKYEGIRLNPVFFDQKCSDQFVIDKMMVAPLSIIDWDLWKEKKALPIIKELLMLTSQLKVVIVYTDGYREALKTVEEVFGENVNYISTGEENLTCIFGAHKSLILLALKQSYNLLELLNVVCDIFIKYNGILATAILDLTSKVNRKSGEIFEAFCKPSEDLYFLQMHFSGLGVSERPHYLTQFVIDKIESGVEITHQIVDELFEYQRNSLIELHELSEEDIKNKIDTAATYMKESLPDEYIDLCDALKIVPISTYKDCLQKCTDVNDWQEVLKKFSPIIKSAKKIWAKQYCDSIFARYSMLELSPEALKETKKHIGEISVSFIERITPVAEIFTNQILPVFIQILISGTTILCNTPELVCNLKYHKYSVKKVSDFLGAGVEMEAKERRIFLVNKLHFGDVLISEDKTDFLLCISPPCDVFRPEKTECIVSFIRGEIIDESQIFKRQRENVHICAIPLEDSLKYIKWKFFDIKNFHLSKRTDYASLCEYQRPLRVDDCYMHQIANQFTTYFMRAGVDELFVEANTTLMKLFR